MKTYRVTNLENPHNLAKKFRRISQDVTVKGSEITVALNSKPWGILAGHMTNITQVIEIADDNDVDASEYDV